MTGLQAPREIKGQVDPRDRLDVLVGLVRSAHRELLALQVAAVEPDPPVPKVSPALLELAGPRVRLDQLELTAIRETLVGLERPGIRDLADSLVSLGRPDSRVTRVLLELRAAQGRSDIAVQLVSQVVRDSRVRLARVARMEAPD